MKESETSASSRLERWIPGVRIFRGYELSWLPQDLAAGITLGAVMVPVGLAFGEMAGVPLAGLYAGIFPLIAYALFGSSRQLIIGPDASMAASIAVSLAPLAAGDAGRLAVMAGLLAVLIGVICVLGSFQRLGIVADFLAKPVIAGLLTASRKRSPTVRGPLKRQRVWAPGVFSSKPFSGRALLDAVTQALQ